MVEEDGTVITSESNYSGGSRYFVTRTLDPKKNYFIQSNLYFQGLIYLGTWEDPDNPQPNPPTPPTPSGKKRSIMILLLKKLKDKRGIKI